MSSKCHQVRTRLTALLAAAAFALSVHAAIDCSFVQFVVPPQTESDERAGLWGYRWWDRDGKQYTCVAYPDSVEIDGRWKAARGFSSLTLAFGGLALAQLLVSNVIRYCVISTSRARRCGISSGGGQLRGTLYLFCCFGSTLSLSFLKSNACLHNPIFNLLRDHQCALSTGAQCTYAAMALWFVAASLALLGGDGAERRRMHLDEGVAGDGGGDDDDATEPLIQDAVLECEQSTYSGRENGEEDVNR